MESVHCAVRTVSLSKTDSFRFQRVKENKIIRKCGTHDGEPKNTRRNLVGKPEAKTPLGRPGHLMVHCTRMEIKENGVVWNGFVWLRIRTSGGFFRTPGWNFKFNKILGILWADRKLAASQEGLCSMDVSLSVM